MNKTYSTEASSVGMDTHIPVTTALQPLTGNALPALKDSGERREFKGGAVRDRAAGKGRFDLIPIHGLLAVAKQMELGAIKYSERNWEKGMPLSCYVDSAMRHLAKFTAGFNDEPHLEAACWNLLCLAEGRARIAAGLWPAEFDDLPKTFAGINPTF